MLLYKTKGNDDPAAQRRYGFSFPDEPSAFGTHPALLCSLKAGLVFSASFGAVGGILSAFRVDYYVLPVMLGLLVFSVVLAFLHYNALMFNLVYPLLFVVFTVSILQCRYIANSGFQSFVSILFEEYSNHFDLSLNREVTITYQNQPLAITVAALFVGFFLSLLLNIAVSTYMSLFGTLLITFPVVQIALYIGNYPAPIYLFLLLFSYVSVGILRRSGHFNFPMKKKKRTQFVVRTRKRPGNGTRLHSYRANAPVLIQTLLLTLGISLLFMGASYSLLLNHEAQQSVSNRLKARTDDYVKIFVQTGFAGFMNRYEATGGIGGGRLGGVSSVRPDYEPDLRVTFAPCSYDTIYLKAFTGAAYTGHEWLAADDSPAYDTCVECSRLRWQYEHQGNTLRAKMKIENLDANGNYLYLPYYTDGLPQDWTPDAGDPPGRLPVGETLELTYYPPQNSGLLTGAFDASDLPALHEGFSAGRLENEPNAPGAEASTVRDGVYTDVPGTLAEVLENEIEKIGTADTPEEQILLIRSYFEDSFAYKTNPGATPLNEDFVEYFLTAQKKGYCTHFASAATLLLRACGYPARYVEGYVLTLADMANAQTSDEDYDEYLQGNNPLGRTGVIETEISDGNAHAWVEVYKDGFGWIPAEVTPPSQESETAYSDFWSIFTDLFSVSGQGTNTTAAQLAENGRSSLASLWNHTDFVSGPVLILILILLLVPLFMRLLQHLRRYYIMQTAFRRGDYAPFLSHWYQKLRRELARRGLLDNETPSPRATASALAALFAHTDGENEEKAADYISLLERGCYSNTGITKKEALRFRKMTREYLRGCAVLSKL